MFHVHGLATNLGQHRCHIVFIGFSLILLRFRCCSLQASCMIHLMFLFYSFCVQLNSYIIPILHITFRWCVRCVCVQHQAPNLLSELWKTVVARHHSSNGRRWFVRFRWLIRVILGFSQSIQCTAGFLSSQFLSRSPCLFRCRARLLAFFRSQVQPISYRRYVYGFQL